MLWANLTCSKLSSPAAFLESIVRKASVTALLQIWQRAKWVTWLMTELLFIRGSHLPLLVREFESINLYISGYATGNSIVFFISSVKENDTQALQIHIPSHTTTPDKKKGVIIRTLKTQQLSERTNELNLKSHGESIVGLSDRTWICSHCTLNPLLYFQWLELCHSGFWLCRAK